MNSCESLRISLAIQLPFPTKYHPSAHQALHDKQNGLEIWCAIIGALSGTGKKGRGGIPRVENRA